MMDFLKNIGIGAIAWIVFILIGITVAYFEDHPGLRGTIFNAVFGILVILIVLTCTGECVRSIGG